MRRNSVLAGLRDKKFEAISFDIVKSCFDKTTFIKKFYKKFYKTKKKLFFIKTFLYNFINFINFFFIKLFFL